MIRSFAQSADGWLLDWLASLQSFEQLLALLVRFLVDNALQLFDLLVFLLDDLRVVDASLLLRSVDLFLQSIVRLGQLDHLLLKVAAFLLK